MQGGLGVHEIDLRVESDRARCAVPQRITKALVTKWTERSEDPHHRGTEKKSWKPMVVLPIEKGDPNSGPVAKTEDYFRRSPASARKLLGFLDLTWRMAFSLTPRSAATSAAGKPSSTKFRNARQVVG
jgi:hypothetical protein